jgi:DNA processing protein
MQNSNELFLNSVVLSFFFSLLPESTWERFKTLQSGLDRGLALTESELWTESGPLAQLKDPWLGRIPMIKQQLQRHLDQGMKFTFPGAADYPETYNSIAFPPVFLSYLGHPVWQERSGVAVVGSRNPSRATTDWCEKALPELTAQTEIFLVSGGAFGVDQIAHRQALRAKAPTVAILPAGLSKIYPSEFSTWAQPIIEFGGALISEFPPETVMEKRQFDRRNRLISGLCIATLIVQARRRSGTLLTARHCMDQGRSLFVVPSHPLDSTYRGGLDLLSEGAQMVLDGVDLAAYVSAELAFHRPHFKACMWTQDVNNLSADLII